jgi:hypothetical protein
LATLGTFLRALGSLFKRLLPDETCEYPPTMIFPVLVAVVISLVGG